MAVPTPAHTALQTMRLERRLPVMAGVLATMVRVHRHGRRWLATPDSGEWTVRIVHMTKEEYEDGIRPPIEHEP